MTLSNALSALSVPFIKILLWALRRAPVALSYRFASLVAAVLTPFFLLFDHGRSPAKASFRRNFLTAFGPDLSPRDLRRLTHAAIKHLCWLVVDYARLPLFNDQALERTVAPELRQRIRELNEEGKGLLVITGHVGVYEVCGMIGGAMGAPLHTVVHPLRNKHFNELLEGLRCHNGQVLLSKRKVMLQVREVLRRGQIVGMVVDENTKRKPAFVPFFGTLASISSSPATLHRLTKVPVLLAFAHRIRAGEYRLKAYGEILYQEHQDKRAYEQSVMEQIAAATERAIRDYPEQWFWNMKRWKTRPPEETPLTAEPGQVPLPPRVAKPELPDFGRGFRFS